LILAGVRRFVIILAALVGGTTVAAALIALATGNSLNRAISLGFYAVGSFCTIVGFAMTMRGALRPGQRDAAPLEDDSGTSRAASGLFITSGLVIMILGMVIDDRVRVL